jgi:hypothetical protein
MPAIEGEVETRQRRWASLRRLGTFEAGGDRQNLGGRKKSPRPIVSR